MRRLPLLLLTASLLVPARATAEPPPLSVLIERISAALGGGEGGGSPLAAEVPVDFIFRRTLREALAERQVIADHRLVREAGGGRSRLDVRIIEGEGRDSAALRTEQKAWLLVDGGSHVVEVAAVDERLEEFGPERLFSVPLALAADGRRLLGAGDLRVSEVGDGASGRLFVLTGEQEGEETARLEVDARTFLPVTVSFRSPAGRITYRYADYREVAPGLVLPFEREFLRDGRQVSHTEVRRLRLSAPADPERFDPEVSTLPALPGGKAP